MGPGLPGPIFFNSVFCILKSLLISLRQARCPLENIKINENKVISLVAAVQFVNIVEFMMVMPLGPDFAKGLGIELSQLGIIGGSYTAAAAISGLISSVFLDRFDRRTALAGTIIGLVISTLVCAFAQNFHMLLFGRVLAGCFGGPATAMALSIVADVVPPQRRGRAMGTIMMAFSLASILGVPIGLELANWGSWRTPFFAVAGLCVIVAGMSIFNLPSLTSHLDRGSNGPKNTSTKDLLLRPMVVPALVMTALMMMSMFTLVPNIAAYVQGNMGYPREDMSVLYFCGGIGSFLIMRPVGVLTDRYGSAIIGSIGAFLICFIMFILFVKPIIGIPVVVLFTTFMMSSSMRSIPHNALTSKVPEPAERARFMSIQSAVQHMAAASGAFLSSAILTEDVNHRLIGIHSLAILSIVLAACVPIFLYMIQRGVGEKPEATIAEPLAN